MIISEDLLIKYGADFSDFQSGETIFFEGSVPNFYFQVVTGTVGLQNLFDDGKEFIQNIMTAGECFAESFLFDLKPYNVTGIAITQCRILKLRKNDFYKLLEDNDHLSSMFLKYFSSCLYDKYFMMLNLAAADPINKIQAILNTLKRDNNYKNPFSFQVPLTRQQIANLTGLRVETVIRTIKKMQNNDALKIENGKIFY